MIFLDLLIIIITIFLLQFTDSKIESNGGIYSLIAVSFSFSVIALLFMFVGARSNFFLQHHLHGIISKYQDLWLNWIDFTTTRPNKPNSIYSSWRNGKYKEKMQNLITNVTGTQDERQSVVLDVLKAASDFLSSEKGNTPFTLFKVPMDYNLLIQILTLFASYVSYIFNRLYGLDEDAVSENNSENL